MSESTNQHEWENNQQEEKSLNHQPLQRLQEEALPEKDYDLETELILMKMQAEFGGEVYFPYNQEISPELKLEFLQSVYDFEEAYRSSVHDLITLYEKIGNPYFVPSYFLTDEGVEEEVKRLKRIMLEKRVIFETEFENDARKIYDFITRELFYIKIEDVDIKGFFKHFIYEDFYPNVEEDLKFGIRMFLNYLAENKLELACSDFNHELFTASGWISCEEASEKISSFRANFRRLSIEKIDDFIMQQDGERWTVKAEIEFKGISFDHEEIVLKGQGLFGFMNSFPQVYLIDELKMPGLTM